MDSSTLKIVSNCHNPEFQKKLVERLDTKQFQQFRLFVCSVQQNTTGIGKTQV